MSPLLAAIEIIDTERLLEMSIGMLFDGIAITSIALLTIRRARSRAINVFTLVIVNIVVFFVTYLMATAAIDTNVGFGLFALFGILRFRTGTLPVLDTTYLFASIAIATFNALALSSLTLVEALVANVVIIAALELIGGYWLGQQAQVHHIIYERIELVHPARRAELLSDLEERTGLQIEGVVVNDINFLNDTAKLSIHVLPDQQLADPQLRHEQAEQYD